MLMARKTLFLFVLVTSGFMAAGCSAPCERYCEATADYISYCLENGSQGEWVAADWSHWGDFSGAEEFITNCNDDLSLQRTDDNEDVLNGNCTDQANSYTEMADRGLCADLP